jgi:transcriptional regulator with GAF, ATPase, and Fis domain
LLVLKGGPFDKRDVVCSRPISVDICITAATSRDLTEMAVDHSFRENLSYRLDMLRITIPPLRDRGRDVIAMLARLGLCVTRSGKRYAALLR